MANVIATDPTVIDSPSHTAGVWSSTTTIDMEWIGGNDSSNGVAGSDAASGVKNYDVQYKIGKRGKWRRKIERDWRSMVGRSLLAFKLEVKTWRESEARLRRFNRKYDTALTLPRPVVLKKARPKEKEI